MKYRLVSDGPRTMRLRSIMPAAAISFNLALTLGADHMPSCFQSNRAETAFSPRRSEYRHLTDNLAYVAASVSVRDLPLTVAGLALDGIYFAAWLHRLLHDWVARSIAGRADVLFDL